MAEHSSSFVRKVRSVSSSFLWVISSCSSNCLMILSLSCREAHSSAYWFFKFLSSVSNAESFRWYSTSLACRSLMRERSCLISPFVSTLWLILYVDFLRRRRRSSVAVVGPVVELEVPMPSSEWNWADCEVGEGDGGAGRVALVGSPFGDETGLLFEVEVDFNTAPVAAAAVVPDLLLLLVLLLLLFVIGFSSRYVALSEMRAESSASLLLSVKFCKVSSSRTLSNCT